MIIRSNILIMVDEMSHVSNMNDLKITEWKVVPFENSPYIQPVRVVFKQNDVQRKWDYIRSHHGVYILIYNSSREAFVLVKQFRPALYMAINREQSPTQNQTQTELDNILKVDNIPCMAAYSHGVAYELCAGLVDKPELSVAEHARDEILEECGYDVHVDKLQKITSWRNEVGHEGSKQTLFYTEVSDSMMVPGGGGGNVDEGEMIELFYLPVSEMQEFMYNEEISKESSVMFAFLWWKDNVASTKIKHH